MGIIVIRDLPPEYAACRERLLKLSYKFAHLDENVRESYSDPTTKYRSIYSIQYKSLINSLSALVGPMEKYAVPHLSSFALSHFIVGDNEWKAR